MKSFFLILTFSLVFSVSTQASELVKLLERSCAELAIQMMPEHIRLIQEQNAAVDFQNMQLKIKGVLPIARPFFVPFIGNEVDQKLFAWFKTFEQNQHLKNEDLVAKLSPISKDILKAIKSSPSKFFGDCMAYNNKLIKECKIFEGNQQKSNLCVNRYSKKIEPTFLNDWSPFDKFSKLYRSALELDEKITKAIKKDDVANFFKSFNNRMKLGYMSYHIPVLSSYMAVEYGAIGIIKELVKDLSWYNTQNKLGQEKFGLIKLAILRDKPETFTYLINKFHKKNEKGLMNELIAYANKNNSTQSAKILIAFHSEEPWIERSKVAIAVGNFGRGIDPL